MSRLGYLGSCATCGCEVRIREQGGASFPQGALPFCSCACLRKHIAAQSPLTDEELQRLGFVHATRSYAETPCHSTRLRANFRSWFEVAVAEDMVFAWNMREVFYEAWTLPLDSTHWYTPDFLVRDHGVFLEVKGEWLLGARSKFERALEIVGPERLLLIPAAYRSWFSKLPGRA